MKDARVNEIDLLRFFAAMAVVLFHYSFRGYAADGMSLVPHPALAPYSKYGYLGVELFFMISGFVILMSAASGNLAQFVASRMARLYPAFWACCTISFLVIIFAGDPRYTASLDQYLLNMTMLSGFLRVPSMDGVYWSIFVEMRFYALVAILLFIGKIHRAELLSVLWLIASVALELFPSYGLRYIFLVDYSAYFIAGAICYLIWSNGFSPVRMVVLGASWILAIFQSLRQLPAFEHHYDVGMNEFIVVGMITAFFLVMLRISFGGIGFIGKRSWVFVGALTYPLYLVHQNVGYIIFDGAYGKMNSDTVFCGTIVVVLSVAYGVNRFVERPLAGRMKHAIVRFFDTAWRLRRHESA
jgi:peptidoglycan/LPS O-acetylase OafA/YrhL